MVVWRRWSRFPAMRVSRMALATAGALSVLAALPVGAAGVTIPAIPQQFTVTVDGTAKYEWENHNGAVGTACRDWNTQEGAVRQKFSTRRAGTITLRTGKIIGTGVGPATITGSIDSTVASSLEPGCPSLCPDAKPAAVAAGHGPRARVADCSQRSVARAERSTSCKAAAERPGALFVFSGASSASLKVGIQAEVASTPDKPCVTIGSGLPHVAKLFRARALRRLGAGRKLRRTRTLSGTCPGTRRTGPALTALGPLTCTYELHVTVTVSRL